MKKTLALFFLVILIISCRKDPEPTSGNLQGMISDAGTGSSLPGVRILVYDSKTNAPTGSSLTSGADGMYSVELNPGTYYVKLSKQGYLSVPPAGFVAVPFTMEVGKVTNRNYQMERSTITDAGSITGKIVSGTNPMAGVLVVAYNSTNSYTSVTAPDGTYAIYNVPAGSYNIKGYFAGYATNDQSVNVVSGSNVAAGDVTLTAGAAASVTGSVSFLATNSGEVEVSLVEPNTKEAIPGLSTKTVSGNYTIANVPPGKYIARASFSNDGYVVDPDWIIKNGEPIVDVSSGSVSLNFSVTGSVKLDTITNISTTTEPAVISDLEPVFKWSAYSSTKDYVIEVSDLNGSVVWGGFSGSGDASVKNIVILKDQLSIKYNSDGKAKSALKKGTVYRWRIYASVDDSKSATGWKLISTSEDQLGLFTIQ